jgi:hypothetical protein
MFPKWSNITIADENYCDVIDFPIDQVTRKQSIASYNFPQKTLFFSHINKLDDEQMDHKVFKLILLTVVNPLGEVYSVACDEATEIAVSRGRYSTFVKVKDLRTSSSLLIDRKGYICKIVSIEDYFDTEDRVYDVKSNKGNSKFVNGLMFKA